MSYVVRDLREHDKGKSTPNRHRYVKRVHDQVKEAVKEVIKDGNIKDVADASGKKVKIPKRGLSQPTFAHSKKGGKRDFVHPGNKEFQQGDRIKRPEEGEGGGGGSGASNEDVDASDEFEFTMTRDEFLDLFFEDLELPDMVKKSIAKVDEWVRERAGFSVDGNPAQMNIVRSVRQSKMRRVGLKGPKRRKIRELQEELDALLLIEDPEEEQKQRLTAIREELAELKRRMDAVPFMDDMDIRYNRWTRVPKPATQAVMFALMDVSASMGEWEKEMSKRFFMLLYLFLIRNYQRVEIVFIRHHTIPKEVDEEEFFYSRETGGTLVSPCLEMMYDIIQERYNPLQWNIFACQASDGDNWNNDSVTAQEVLKHKLLPITQYFAYVEIMRRKRTSDLWPYYEEVKGACPNFAMSVITDVNEIYPVFRGLFEKREGAKK